MDYDCPGTQSKMVWVGTNQAIGWKFVIIVKNKNIYYNYYSEMNVLDYIFNYKSGYNLLKISYFLIKKFMWDL